MSHNVIVQSAERIGADRERAAIVAWLRSEASSLKDLARAQVDMRDRTYVFGRMWEIESLAKWIERGAHVAARAGGEHEG